MPKQEHTHPFIEHLVRNDGLVKKAVNAAVAEEVPAVTSMDYIDFAKLESIAPAWAVESLEEITTLFYIFNNSVLWEELIRGSGFKPPALLEEGLIGKSARSIPAAAREIKNRTGPGLDFVFPAFGIAALVGNKTEDCFKPEAWDSPVTRRAVVAGKVFQTRSEIPLVFADRLTELFPASLDGKTHGSAWFYLHHFKAFELEGRVCPAVGLTKQILSAFGSELEAEGEAARQNYLVGERGLEPPTSRSQTARSTN